jgi:hypothetical protein
MAASAGIGKVVAQIADADPPEAADIRSPRNWFITKWDVMYGGQKIGYITRSRDNPLQFRPFTTINPASKSCNFSRLRDALAWVMVHRVKNWAASERLAQHATVEESHTSNESLILVHEAEEIQMSDIWKSANKPQLRKDDKGKDVLHIPHLAAITPDQWEKISGIMRGKGYDSRGAADASRAVQSMLRRAGESGEARVLKHEDWVDTIAKVIGLKASSQELKAGDRAATARKVFARAVKSWGLTNNPDVAGYILPNGSMLDLSGGSGRRAYDHRQVGSFLEPSEQGRGATDCMHEFMDLGAIRWMPEGPGMDIRVPPTKAQYAQIARIKDEAHGQLYLDVYSPNYGKAYRGYGPSHTSQRVVNDIVSFYKTGKLGHMPEVQQFHGMGESEESEFFKSFTSSKYAKEIEFWNIATTPMLLISTLRDLKVPAAAFVEISVALTEEVLPKFEEAYSENLQPRKAIEAAKAWLKDRTAANAEAAETADYAAAVAADHVASYSSSASYVASAASYTARAAHTAHNSQRASYDAYAINAIFYYTAKAGLSATRMVDIIKRVGHQYFAFLPLSKSSKVAEAGETLDPAEFVKSYHADKYGSKIRDWSLVSEPVALLRILESLNAPKSTYVEINIALAEEVLPVFEKKRPKDLRPRKAIEAAKAWFKDRTSANAQIVLDVSQGAWKATNACTSSPEHAAFAIYYATVSVTAETVSPSGAWTAIDAAHYTVADVINAGIPKQRVADIIREVGRSYFGFLPQEGHEKAEEPAVGEALDPSEFVKSYTTAKYQKAIHDWGTATTPGDLNLVLKSLKAPKAAFVEVAIAFAEEVLPMVEKVLPNDLRPRQAIEAAKVWLKDRTEANAQAANEASDEALAASADAATESYTAWNAVQTAARAANMAWVASTDDDAGMVYKYASYINYYTTRAGLSNQRAMDIFREIGGRYFSFLAQSPSEGMAEVIVTNLLDEVLDPAEFVQSYAVAKYQKEIETWNKAATPLDFIHTLKALKAPKAAFVEISLACAEKVLPEFEESFPKDLRPRKAVEAVKAWLKNRTGANTQVAANAARAAYAAAHATWAVNSTKAARIARAANAAARAASAAAAAGAISYDISGDTAAVATYAVEAGLPSQRVMDIIKEVGHKYFSFLGQGTARGMAEAIVANMLGESEGTDIPSPEEEPLIADISPEDIALRSGILDRYVQVGGDFGDPWVYGGTWYSAYVAKSKSRWDCIYHIDGMEGEGLSDYDAGSKAVKKALEEPQYAALIAKRAEELLPDRLRSQGYGKYPDADPAEEADTLKWCQREVLDDAKNEIADKLADEMNKNRTLAVYRVSDDDLFDNNPKRISEVVQFLGITLEEWEEMPTVDKIVAYADNYGWYNLDHDPVRMTKDDLIARIKVEL